MITLNRVSRKSRAVHVALVLLMACIGFYLAGMLLPWRFGLFGIERYPYSSAYQILFILILMATTILWYNFTNQKCGVITSIATGAALGFLSSLVAYLIAFSFFYSSQLSSAGAVILIEMLASDPVRYILEMCVLAIILVGWLYGAMLAFLANCLR